MSENNSFTIICNNCNAKIKITNTTRTEKISVKTTSDFSSDKIITCKECGNTIHFI